MSQQYDKKVSEHFQSSERGVPLQRSMKDMLDLVQHKKQHYKKALSQIQTHPHQPHLKYIINISNEITKASPQQKEILKQQQLARGSIPEIEQSSLLEVPKKLRIKLETLSRKRRITKRSSDRNMQRPYFERYRTEPSEQTTMELKRSILCSSPKPLPIIKKEQATSNKLMVCVAQAKRSGKSNDKLEKIYSILSASNPFFMKVDRVIGVCLLRIGRIEEFAGDFTLYELGAKCSRLYIILQGSAKLKGTEGMRKICQTGETLLEQTMFGQNDHSLQKAVIVKKSVLLEIQRSEYEKLLQQLYKFGFKQGAQQLGSILRRNFIVKNWLRNKFRIMYKS